MQSSRLAVWPPRDFTSGEPPKRSNRAGKNAQLTGSVDEGDSIKCTQDDEKTTINLLTVWGEHEASLVDRAQLEGKKQAWQGRRGWATHSVLRSNSRSTLASRGPEASTLEFSLNWPWTGLSLCESGVRDMLG